METRKLGNSDLHITRVGYGAWAVGGSGWQFAWGSQDDDDSIATGSRVAQRIQEIAPDHGSSVEVFCFGPAQRRLAGGGDSAAIATFSEEWSSCAG